MPTTKKRLNITLSPETEEILKVLSERDDVPQATKASELIRKAIETDEDEVLNKLAEERDTKDSQFISHKEVWS